MSKPAFSFVIGIISGEAQGFLARLMRMILTVGAWVYSLVIRFRNRGYDSGWLKSYKLSVPVICVGNITTGGTGKTPLVELLGGYLQKRGVRVALLSRGYQAQGGGDNDEVRILRERLGGVEIVVDSNRVRGGRKAISEHGAEVLLLDDGFQHRRLQRDLDIVLIDCTCPFGYGAVLPRGLLREPIDSLSRAGVVVLTRCDQVSNAELSELSGTIKNLSVKSSGGNKESEVVIAQCCHQGQAIFSAGGEQMNVQAVQGKKLFAFCGIGNPESFVKTLEKLGGNVVGSHFFSDHFHYTVSDVQFLRSALDESGAEILITTEKDWVKLRELPGVNELANLWWLQVRAVLTEGQDELLGKIDELIDQYQDR